MTTTTAPADAGQRWMARLALLLVVAAGALLVAVAGTKTLALFALVAGGVVVMLVGAWLLVAHRGVVRALGAVLLVGAAATVVVAQVRHHVLWAVLVAVGLAACA